MPSFPTVLQASPTWRDIPAVRGLVAREGTVNRPPFRESVWIEYPSHDVRIARDGPRLGNQGSVATAWMALLTAWMRRTRPAVGEAMLDHQ